jgi:hypothetical protein
MVGRDRRRGDCRGLAYPGWIGRVPVVLAACLWWALPAWADISVPVTPVPTPSSPPCCCQVLCSCGDPLIACSPPTEAPIATSPAGTTFRCLCLLGRMPVCPPASRPTTDLVVPLWLILQHASPGDLNRPPTAWSRGEFLPPTREVSFPSCVCRAPPRSLVTRLDDTA